MDNSISSAALTRQTPEHGNIDVSFPLRNVVLCCTSIPQEQRTQLAGQAEQMGAEHKYDLTSEVTHLIVGDYDTPKYRYVAKERPDVKVLRPSWIEAIRQLWIEDLYIDISTLEKKHTLSTFAGLKICMTGFDDPVERKTIIDMVSSHGGNYSGNLTKQISHLIAFRPDGAKYSHAKTWGLHIVSIEWVHDSIERGMILDETLYSLDLPQQERGKDAWKRHQPQKSPLGKRRRDDVASSRKEGKRRLRRTASTKLNSQNGDIWGDIVGDVAGKIHIAESEKRESSTDAGRLLSNTTNLTLVTEPTKMSPDIHPALPDNSTRGIFSTCTMYIHGFGTRQDKVLREFLLSHDADICTSTEDFGSNSSLRSFVVTPHSIPNSEMLPIPTSRSFVETVTEFWIERCLEAKAVVEPSDYAFGRPFPVFPISGIAGLIVCSTGFSGLELLHLSKAVALLGAKYGESFSSAASILVCNPNRTSRVEKLDLARVWKVPVVSTSWLIDCISHGVKQPITPYLIHAKVPRSAGFADSGRHDRLEKPSKQDQKIIRATDTRHPLQHFAPEERARPARSSNLDVIAFDDDKPATIQVKEDSSDRDKVFYINTTEPLKEISPNSPKKPSMYPDRQLMRLPNPVLQQDLNTAITSLLARTKSTVANVEISDQADLTDALRRKRTTSRILGRAASNVSSASATMSRASSVDSTASTGQAVIWPSRSRKTASYEQESYGHLSGSTHIIDHEDDQPPPTQRLGYEDTESNAYKEQIVAKMTGTKLQRKEKEKVATVASLDMAEGLRPRKLRRRAEPGFR